MILILVYCIQEVQSITSVTELEKLLLEHGEQVIDMLGSEVDRIEMKIKVSTFIDIVSVISSLTTERQS